MALPAGTPGLALLSGCAGGVVRADNARGPFNPALPPGGGGAAGPPLDLLLAGLVLGLALGFILGLAWPAWRRRRAQRAARRSPRHPALGLPGDLNRLRAALGLLEELLEDWRGRKSRSKVGAEDETRDRAPGRNKPGGRCRL